MTRAELECILSTSAQFISGADSKPMLSIKQDSMVGGYVLTYGFVKVSKETFMDACMKTEWSMDYVRMKIKHMKFVLKWCGFVDSRRGELVEENIQRKHRVGELLEKLKQNKCLHTREKIKHNISPLSTQFKLVIEECKYEINALRNKISEFESISDLDTYIIDNFVHTGHGIISMLFPINFEYTCNNKMSPDKSPVKITRGVLIQGTLNKDALGSSSGSLIHHLYKDYGGDFGCKFVTYYQRFMNLLISRRGFSAGMSDCIPKNTELIKAELNKSFIHAKVIMEIEQDLEMRETKISEILNQSTNIGDKIASESLTADNNFVKMIISGAKGNLFNTVNITSAIGQQNIEGKRVPKNYGGRSLPCYKGTPGRQHAPDLVPDDEELDVLFQSRGFILSSFYEGLSPQEFFFLSAGGREGLIDTSCKTAKCGYLSRRLLKSLEDVKIGYNQMVVNSRGSVIEFVYGEDNVNAAELIRTEKNGMQISDVGHIIEKLNADYEWKQFCEKENIDNEMFKVD